MCIHVLFIFNEFVMKMNITQHVMQLDSPFRSQEHCQRECSGTLVQPQGTAGIKTSKLRLIRLELCKNGVSPGFSNYCCFSYLRSFDSVVILISYLQNKWYCNSQAFCYTEYCHGCD